MSSFSISPSENNRKVHFKLNKSKYVIPSKLFPLVKPSQMRVFTKESVSPIELNIEQIKNIMEKCNFRLGSCYDNAEMFDNLSKVEQVEGVEVYSGWLFSTDDFPVHHVWIVVDGNSIIDGTILKNSMNVLLELGIKFSDNPSLIRTEYVKKLKELWKAQIPNYEKFIFGEIPGNFLYIGCPSTAQEARDVFRKLSSSFPNHPAYGAKGMNQNGLSDLQKEIYS